MCCDIKLSFTVLIFACCLRGQVEMSIGSTRCQPTHERFQFLAGRRQKGSKLNCFTGKPGESSLAHASLRLWGWGERAETCPCLFERVKSQ